jgi:hypothetical protein
MASVLRIFATRFNDIGTSLPIFWSSRNSRTAKAARNVIYMKFTPRRSLILSTDHVVELARLRDFLGK